MFQVRNRSAGFALYSYDGHLLSGLRRRAIQRPRQIRNSQRDIAYSSSHASPHSGDRRVRDARWPLLLEGDMRACSARRVRNWRGAGGILYGPAGYILAIGPIGFFSIPVSRRADRPSKKSANRVTLLGNGYLIFAHISRTPWAYECESGDYRTPGGGQLQTQLDIESDRFQD